MSAARGWSRTVRAWAALLMLSVVLASFMHVAHTHEADKPRAYHACSFCVTLDRGSAPPPAVLTFAPAPAPVAIPPTAQDLPATRALVRSPCHPRAPPVLQA